MRGPGWVRSPSLTVRLTSAVVAVVAAVCVLLTTLTTSAVGALLTDRLDRDLTASHARAVKALQRRVPVLPTDEPRPAPPEIREVRGQVAGTLTAYFVGDAGQGRRIGDDGTDETLDAAALTALREDTGGAGEVAHSVKIGDLGQHRVLSTALGDLTLVTALPTSSVDETVGSLVGWGWLFAGLGTLLAGGTSALVVRRQLSPLREVAATVHTVTALDLTSGEVEVPRVPAHLVAITDEVGQVAQALDAVLGHVDEALEVRHRSDQQVRQFVADASHELRTPLATVRGYSDLALREGADDETKNRALDKVRTESFRMSGLVEDLLLLARLDQGRPLDRAEVDLTHLVLEGVADAQVTAPSHRWRMELSDEPVTVPGDAARLHQVLTNLLVNASRHTPEGTTVTTTVGAAETSGQVVLKVHDDGPGIAPEVIGDVFERFTRGDSARTRASSGAGLGLSLARSIVRAHGGDLTVESRPGSTCFTATLPAA
ncbi:sensor histidine kinase [Nocardioides yefusunii]|uniref:histidine kinase n=1 Tax=Nocardioides yefusunii TaxID=2500546 RepID=A0ABW1QZX0_9ACTN|nr:HAMP domain-containing sensor histidine kinase [Nocardioides yefusunii]